MCGEMPHVGPCVSTVERLATCTDSADIVKLVLGDSPSMHRVRETAKDLPRLKNTYAHVGNLTRLVVINHAHHPLCATARLAHVPSQARLGSVRLAQIRETEEGDLWRRGRWRLGI